MEYHCKYYKDAHFRCGLAFFFTHAPQSLTHRLPLHAVDLVLCVRMAGLFSRLLASQPTILGFVVAYSPR